jgi:hypothetical protein
MSISSLQNNVASIEKDIADIHTKIAAESKRELDKQKQMDTVSRSITKTTNASSLATKQRQINTFHNELISIQKKKADLHKKLADKTKDLGKKRQDLLKEEEKERKSQKQELQDFQNRIESNLTWQRASIHKSLNTNYIVAPPTVSIREDIKNYDFFISHASEDKEDFVRPLADALISEGCSVWYDEHQLKVGDSLRKKIDTGLKSSKFGIVVLSENFFRKNWPEYELNGLVARELRGTKVILPIWHKVTRDEVLNFSPILADKLALNSTTYSLGQIAKELVSLLY